MKFEAKLIEMGVSPGQYIQLMSIRKRMRHLGQALKSESKDYRELLALKGEFAEIMIRVRQNRNR